MIKRYALYLFRWQLSTPILALCLHFLGDLDNFWATVIANLIGGLIFFWVDRLIFSKNYTKEAKTDEAGSESTIILPQSQTPRTR